MDIKDIREKYPQYSDVPDEKLLQGLHAKFYSDMPYEQFSSKITGANSEQKPVEQPKSSYWDEVKRGAINTGKNIAAGAADIGATLMLPTDTLQDYINGDRGKNLSSLITGVEKPTRNQERRKAIDEFAGDSAAGQTTRILTNIAGTAGVGSLLAQGARAIPALTPKIAASLESGGFSLGGRSSVGVKEKLINALIRAGGGAASGAVGAGAVGANPISGGAIGALLPGGGAILGGSRRLVSPVFTPKDSALRNMEAAAGGKGRLAEAILKATKASENLPLNTRMTMGQTSGNEGIAALERASAGRNAAAFQDTYSAQRNAMVDAIEELSGTDALRHKIVQNRHNMTEPLYSANNAKMVGGDKIDEIIERTPPSVINDALKNARMRGEIPTRSVYEEVPSQGRTLQDIERQRAELPNAGSFDTGVQDVEKELGKQTSLLSYLRSKGGISSDELSEITGEKLSNKSGVQVGTFANKGRGIDDAVLIAVEGGYLPRSVLEETDGGVQMLRDSLREEAHGGAKTYRMDAMDTMNFNAYPAPDMPLDTLSIIGKPANPIQMEYQQAGKQHSGGMIDALRKQLFANKEVAFRSGDSNAGSGYAALLNDVRGFQETATPEGALANKLFRELSPDVNRIDVARALRDKLVPALRQSQGTDLKLTGAQYAKALSDAQELVRKETGQNQTISQLFADRPEHLKKLTDIEKLVAGQSYLNQAGTGANSTTAQLQQYAGLLKNISEGAGGLVDKTSKAITHFSRTEGAINELLQNPKMLADAIINMEKRGLIANPTNSVIRSGLTQRGN